MERRETICSAEGKTKTEIMRCLKRYIAREVFLHLLADTPTRHAA
jgi:transposase